ncbi:hypothetical protein DMUE_1235 [Dictyocoela muelleri]|nr:hypothetical protein DMUE_1235 [Dictyocoela muelleri]
MLIYFNIILTTIHHKNKKTKTLNTIFNKTRSLTNKNDRPLQISKINASTENICSEKEKFEQSESQEQDTISIHSRLSNEFESTTDLLKDILDERENKNIFPVNNKDTFLTQEVPDDHKKFLNVDLKGDFKNDLNEDLKNDLKVVLKDEQKDGLKNDKEVDLKDEQKDYLKNDKEVDKEDEQKNYFKNDLKVNLEVNLNEKRISESLNNLLEEEDEKVIDENSKDKKEEFDMHIDNFLSDDEDFPNRQSQNNESLKNQDLNNQEEITDTFNSSCEIRSINDDNLKKQFEEIGEEKTSRVIDCNDESLKIRNTKEKNPFFSRFLKMFNFFKKNPKNRNNRKNLESKDKKRINLEISTPQLINKPENDSVLNSDKKLSASERTDLIANNISDDSVTQLNSQGKNNDGNNASQESIKIESPTESEYLTNSLSKQEIAKCILSNKAVVYENPFVKRLNHGRSSREFNESPDFKSLPKNLHSSRGSIISNDSRKSTSTNSSIKSKRSDSSIVSVVEELDGENIFKRIREGYTLVRNGDNSSLN